ncbi:MAG TPA: diguanylate cyclase [Ruminococcus sp.]|nr:diguanylate cyclase [Ruminococcus sp.]
MTELMKTIRERRSIRRFRSDPVPKEMLESIIEAGLYAASGWNEQLPKIIAVTNRELRDRISAANCEIGGWDKGFDPFYGAPAIIIVIVPGDGTTGVCDGSLTLGNMMLEAHELGLGSVWIHRAKEEFEGNIGKEILERLGLEGRYIGIGHLAVGYPEGEPPLAPERKPDRVFFIE